MFYMSCIHTPVLTFCYVAEYCINLHFTCSHLIGNLAPYTRQQILIFVHCLFFDVNVVKLDQTSLFSVRPTKPLWIHCFAYHIYVFLCYKVIKVFKLFVAFGDWKHRLLKHIWNLLETIFYHYHFYYFLSPPPVTMTTTRMN